METATLEGSKMRTYTARVTFRGKTFAGTHTCVSSESAAVRTAQDSGADGPAHVEVGMHFAGRVVPVAVYARDGRDVTFVGRPSTSEGRS